MTAFPRSPRGRTVLGAILGLLFVPLMLGITACLELPTPIGDPERGWVDPRVTGVWMAGERDDDGVWGTIIWILEPYDSRTWLVTWTEVGGTPSDPADESGVSDAGSAEAGTADGAVPDEAPGESPETTESPEEDDSYHPPPRLTGEQVNAVVAELEAETVKCQTAVVFKGWLTSIGKSRYLVLEPRQALSSEYGLAPHEWWIFRLVLRDGAMELSIVGLPDGVKTRGEAETVIAARANDPELVVPYLVMARVPQEHYDTIAEAMSNATLSSGF